MFYEKLCGVLLAQLSFHDAMLKSAKEKAKVRQEMSTVVLGVMVVGIVAYAGIRVGRPTVIPRPHLKWSICNFGVPCGHALLG
ncbi:MAG: hypothetical protein OXU86_02025 [Thaumarchaeota archaeon]|nr:hypothetical protein [Nitrososphaerota archaeon]MDD9825544.1 hypothetical protein [Nitrososphaerota archaeon]MDD9843168.1 hypothetical protein [Nitrososphaerota archaeon]